MSVRSRTLPSGKIRWQADYRDDSGKRRSRQFDSQREAKCFHAAAIATSPDNLPKPFVKGYRPWKFIAPLPLGGLRNSAGRKAVAEAFDAAHPIYEPSTANIILHIRAEMPPSSAVADVDNLLKPVLDALKGHAWVDDTQICELLVRRIPGRKRKLHIKFWNVPAFALSSLVSA